MIKQYQEDTRSRGQHEPETISDVVVLPFKPVEGIAYIGDHGQ